MIRAFRLLRHVRGGVLALPLRGGKREFISNGKYRVLDNGLVTKVKPRQRTMDRPQMNDTKLNIHMKGW